MTSKGNALLLFIIGATIAFMLGVAAALEWQKFTRVEPTTIVETVTVRDTVTIEKPVVRGSLIVRYKRVEVPVTVRDTIRDTTFIEIPIESKYYNGKNYEAWVSGFQPSLDSISVFNEIKYIREIEECEDKRWGLGLSVGYGAVKDRLQPFVGISVNYNMFTW